MPRKTLALLVGLILLTVILFVIALQTGKQAPQADPAKAQATPTPDIAHTTLSMSPEVVLVSSGRQGSVDVLIDTSDNKVTAIQLELLYDPTMLSNVKVVSGPVFPTPNVLINKNDTATGKYTYSYGLQPGKPSVTGKGVVAKITFTARGVAGKQSQIIMQNDSLVAAQGVPRSVLQSGTGATVVISAPTGTQTQTRPAAAATTTPTN